MRSSKLNSKRQALLAERAHGMRHAPTASEAALWRLVAGSQLGAAFRRQVPIRGRFIADFLAPSRRLIIEVDGASHARRAAADARRDRVLRRLGYRVLHVSAKLVMQQPELVAAQIQAALRG